MLRKALVFLLSMAAIIPASAQTSYLQLGTEDYSLLDKLETRSGRLTQHFFTPVKPIPRKGAVAFLEEKRNAADSLHLSNIDLYNIDHMISVSGEWAADENGGIDSKRPWFKTFYKKQPDLLQVHTPDFFLVVNPVISATGLYETGSRKSDSKFSSSRGIELRGTIAKKLGFYSYLADNQEQPVAFMQEKIEKFHAVPGADNYVFRKKKYYDYILARGYIDFAMIKDHINISLGYDKQFFGDGIRSLVLSDQAASSTFLRLNTHIWKLNYQNLYLELTPQFVPDDTNRRIGHKYATIHYLSVNATHWLNIGVFESVLFSRPDRYEFSYMIPIIFYRAIERGLGSPDNVNIGLTFKAIAARHLQFYGQLMLDEFKSKELFGGKGWWGNKFGIQLGGKYFDALTVKNLDLQGEINLVRPYTYSHFDSSSNYTHYNQPLAHPLGAGFAEIIGIARYQPIKKLYLSLKGVYYKQGVDTGTMNNGSDIFLSNKTRSSDFGIKLINGPEASCISFNINLSYELRENLFIDLGGSRRVYSEEGKTHKDITNYVYACLRLNIARRDYDIY